MNQTCECQCGKTTLQITGKPITRIACHCEICQEFNQAEFADITLFLSKDVKLNNESSVSFKSYQSPPLLKRGKCIHCNTATVERFKTPISPSITLIPSSLIPAGESLPNLNAHIFCHRKVNEINDSLPKIDGFLKSQLYISKALVSGLLKNTFSSKS